MNVLHVLDNSDFYGAAAMVLELAKTQQEIGINVKVLFLSEQRSSPSDAIKKFSNSSLVTSFLNSPKWNNLALFRQYSAELRRNDSDIIHCHGYIGSIFSAMLSKRTRLKVLRTLHGYTDLSTSIKLRLYYALDRYAMLRIAHVSCVSATTLRSLTSMGFTGSADVVRNGVRKSAVAPIDRPPKEPFRIVSIGRLAPEKNYSFLIDAAKEARTRNLNCVFEIAGEGPERNMLQKSIDQFELHNYIALAGYVSDVKNFISESDAYVNCSTTEGMPMTLMEVIQIGRPILASDIAANKELFSSHPELASIFDRNSTADFISKLENIIFLDANSRDALCRRQRIVFDEKFSCDKTAEAYAIIYESLYRAQKQLA